MTRFSSWLDLVSASVSRNVGIKSSLAKKLSTGVSLSLTPVINNKLLKAFLTIAYFPKLFDSAFNLMEYLD